MNYAYDRIERELKKDLFRHLVRAKYTNSSEVSRNLITQFTDDLDEIAYSIWKRNHPAPLGNFVRVVGGIVGGGNDAL
ncbi:18430_t:CDS:2 [Funneliformis geosporum]|nr:18430_t:CDS:2 [Funneliformis geosporum]